MSAAELLTTQAATRPSVNPATRAAIESACARIAPSWPLDQFIAVNPWWGFIDDRLPAAGARLARLSGARSHMPRSWYRERYAAGDFDRDHLEQVIAMRGLRLDARTVLAELHRDEDARPAPRVPLMTAIADQLEREARPSTWTAYVTQAISQFCAAQFDEGQASWGAPEQQGLLTAWREVQRLDRSAGLLMGIEGFGHTIEHLAPEPEHLIDELLQALAVPPACREEYLLALLLSINGWASWCAYRRWQARLGGGDDQAILELLAIRLAWEWLLLRHAPVPALDQAWATALREWPAKAAPEEAPEWLFQAALEQAYQARLVAQLSATPLAEADEVALQAVFCIDVRSEPFRRALEASSPKIRTSGFAGFFGLPVSYAPLGTARERPQLPGLLAPGWTVEDELDTAASATRRRQRQLQRKTAWTSFKTAAVSGFSYIETAGFASAGALLRDSLFGRAADQPDAAGLSGATVRQLRPRLARSTATGEAITLEQRIALAAGVLGAMSMRVVRAPIVLLVGHGSQTVNNPHAAGLDCGACCGQTGEVNARALAGLLNDAEVRAGLAARGFELPAETRFVGALHNTTTDDVRLFEVEDFDPATQVRLAEVRAWLAEAGARVRAERAPGLGLQPSDPERLMTRILGRARDWSQVRPEWGLADNAAFIVAPRARSRAIDLGGRSFLHDYDWRRDEGSAVLELIMTAPMVVTHWINLQYYASVVDPQRYGSGNKVLHNVVGGRIGVFEGNTGDLRIGLPLQSVHDGERWRHTPLRLSVFIEAPQSAIAAIIERHDVVRRLVDHGWLHLFQIESADNTVSRWQSGRWLPAAEPGRG